MTGLYRVSRKAMTESKVGLDEIDGALAELADVGFAFYEDKVSGSVRGSSTCGRRNAAVAVNISRSVAGL